MMNVLGLALGVIGTTPGLQLLKFTGRATNAAGRQVASYAPAVDLQGNAQPVPQRLYQNMGLDFAKTYIVVYTLADVIAVARDGSGDCVTFAGDRFVCENLTDWKFQNGWTAVLAVKVGAAA